VLNSYSNPLLGGYAEQKPTNDPELHKSIVYRDKVIQAINVTFNSMKSLLTISLTAAVSLLSYGCSNRITTAPSVPNTPTVKASAQTPSITNETQSAAPTAEKAAEKTTETVSSEPSSSAPMASQVAASPSPEAKPSNMIGSRQDRSWEAQGEASTGEKVLLSLDSIQVALRSLGIAQPPTYFFQYRIGGERIYGVTACNGRFSTSQDGDRYDDPNTPQSQATQQMLDRVCNYRVKTAQISSPPSHVRMGAKGEIICTIQNNQAITTYGQDGEWFYTDACGKLGMIHASQIR
jgi:hypothetical protein